MARTSAITTIFVVAFVLVVFVSNEVQADSQCMSKCNSKCLQNKKSNSVNCGVACFVECLDYGSQKNQLSSDLKAKLDNLKKKAIEGSINNKEVQGELLDIAKHMMVISSIKLHDHDHMNGEKPIKAPVNLKEDDIDITDDDDEPNA